MAARVDRRRRPASGPRRRRGRRHRGRRRPGHRVPRDRRGQPAPRTDQRHRPLATHVALSDIAEAPHAAGFDHRCEIAALAQAPRLRGTRTSPWRSRPARQSSTRLPMRHEALHLRHHLQLPSKIGNPHAAQDRYPSAHEQMRISSARTITTRATQFAGRPDPRGKPGTALGLEHSQQARAMAISIRRGRQSQARPRRPRLLVDEPVAEGARQVLVRPYIVRNAHARLNRSATSASWPWADSGHGGCSPTSGTAARFDNDPAAALPGDELQRLDAVDQASTGAATIRARRPST